jgi:hypothetical protein
MKRLRFRLLRAFGAVLVIGVGLAGSVAIGSASTDAGAATPPTNDSPPRISGSPVVGQALSASTGTWSGDTPMTFSYRWQRCNTAGGSCAAIGGATGQTYTVASADSGHTLRVDVTASNGAGTASQLSAPTAAVTKGPPVNTVAPKVTGSLTIGSVLRVSPGTWTGQTPIRISYRWERCDTNGGNCAGISGATGSSYQVTSADANHRIVVVVTATNSVGSKDAVATAGNVGGPPVSTAAPTVTGTLAVGNTVSISSGTWGGTQPIGFAYQWDRCDANGGNCVAIAGATSAAYKVTTADAGHRLVVIVTARNSVGSTRLVVTAGNVGGGLPGGAVLVDTVSLPDQLVIDRVSFTPNPIRSRNPVVARFHVAETAGHRSVSGALVYVLGLPYGWTYNANEVPTDATGWATIELRPTVRLPAGHRAQLVLFVRARKPGESLLTGVSTRRLVQVAIR